jgi:hypothetical protein
MKKANSEMRMPLSGLAGRQKLMLSVLIAASTLFLIRGPFRAFQLGAQDFAAPYVSSVKFVNRLDPYSDIDFLSTWYVRGAAKDTFIDGSGQRPIYPPTTLLIMAPFSELNWNASVLCYICLCTVLWIHQIYLLSNMIDDSWNSWCRIGFVACALSLAPIHTAFATSNLSLLTLILCIYCLLLVRQGRDAFAAILLTLAIGIKPTLCAAMPLYFLCCKRWRVLALTGGMLAVLAGASMLQMSFIPATWHTSYQSNLSYLFGPVGAANFSTNPFRYDLLNLQVPLFLLLNNTSRANEVAWIVVAVFGAIWLYLFIIGEQDKRNRLETAVVLMLLALLPIYQRYYNAGFVLFAFLWAFQHFEVTLAKCVLFVSATFLVPISAILRNLSIYIPEKLVQSFFWKFFILQQGTWGILLLVVLLLFAMAKHLPTRLE